MRRGDMLLAIFAAVLAFILVSGQAYAYLDPGTGSYILQLLIAGVLGGLFAIKIYWAKLKAFFQSRFSKAKSDPGGDAPQDEH